MRGAHRRELAVLEPVRHRDINYCSSGSGGPLLDLERRRRTDDLLTGDVVDHRDGDLVVASRQALTGVSRRNLGRGGVGAGHLNTVLAGLGRGREAAPHSGPGHGVAVTGRRVDRDEVVHRGGLSGQRLVEVVELPELREGRSAEALALLTYAVVVDVRPGGSRGARVRRRHLALLHGDREGLGLVRVHQQGRTGVRTCRLVGEGEHGLTVSGDRLLGRLTAVGHTSRVGGAVRVADRDRDVPGLARLDARHRGDVHGRRLVGRRVGAGEGDLRLRLGLSLRLRGSVDLVQELDLLGVGRRDLDAALDADGCARGRRSRSLSVTVELATRALERCLHLGLHRSVGLDRDVQLDIALVANLHHLVVHVVDVATHAVAARLDQLHLADLPGAAVHVVDVLVQAQRLVPLEDRRPLDRPLESTDDVAVLAGVADDTARHRDDDGLAPRLLGDRLGLVGALGVPHLDVRCVPDGPLADLDAVVGVPPGQLGRAIDERPLLLGDVGRSLGVGVADTLDGDAGVGAGGADAHQTDHHEQGRDEESELLHDPSFKGS